MNAEPRSVVAQADSPIAAFSGVISRTRPGPLYQAGLVVVAFAMVLLPLVYLGLIALTTGAVYWHLTNDLWILDRRSGAGWGSLGVLLYFSPAVVGCILVLFMVKPFFAARTIAPDPVTLDPSKELLLFGFVQRICGLVGAPVPSRVDVDCQVNASASLRRGIWSRDLVLTIGLPLAAGLDMRQFASVLAHEFGHFAQGAGLRLTFVIRTINLWFARVVYERDAWDIKLEKAARGIDLRIGVVLHAARGCVWLTRRILWALMHVGHAFSCFMLRQMEYDADSYGAKLAGSETFETTASRLRVLSVATQFAYEDVRQSWASSRLPQDLPLLIDHKAGSLPPEVYENLLAAAASERTGWFDTHPCDTDRTRAVRRLEEPGVFRLDEPAAALFSDFAALSRTVTRHQYEKHLELDFTEQNLMSTEEILRESAASAQADAVINKYYGGVNVRLLPLLTTGELPPVGDSSEAAANWRASRESTERLRVEAQRLSGECMELQTRMTELIAALCLAKAGFRLKPQDFGLPKSATSVGKQEIAARLAADEAASALSDRLAMLEPFMLTLRQRVTLSLRLAPTDAVVPHPEPDGEADKLTRLLAAVGAEVPRAHELSLLLNAFVLLVKNRDNHSALAEVDRVTSERASQLHASTHGILERLKPFAYPFPHARGHLTVAEYARFDALAENDWQRAYLGATTLVERLFALHYQLIGRVLADANAAETKLEEIST